MAKIIELTVYNLTGKDNYKKETFFQFNTYNCDKLLSLSRHKQ